MKKVFAWVMLVLVHIILTGLIGLGGYVINEILYEISDWAITGEDGWWIWYIPHCMWALAKARKALLTVIK